MKHKLSSVVMPLLLVSVARGDGGAARLNHNTVLAVPPTSRVADESTSIPTR